jgi:hypothetical protein
LSVAHFSPFFFSFSSLYSVSKAIVKGLVKVAEEIGSAVAESVVESDFGKKLGGSDGNRFKGPRADAAKEVGKSSLTAIINVWDSLEHAGRMLLHQTSHTTVDVVDYKYGKEAAKVTKDGLDVTTDIVETAYNVQQLGVKKIAKRVALETGKSAAKTYIGTDEDEEPRKLIQQ